MSRRPLHRTIHPASERGSSGPNSRGRIGRPKKPDGNAGGLPMSDRPKSYESYGSQSTSSGYSSSYGSQTRLSSYLGRSSETRGTPTSSYSAPPPQPRPSTYPAGSNEMRGADIIAEYLVKEKIPYILGYAGHG